MQKIRINKSFVIPTKNENIIVEKGDIIQILSENSLNEEEYKFVCTSCNYESETHPEDFICPNCGTQMQPMLENRIKEEIDVNEIIKDLQGNFSKDNESQMKATQLLKGLATSDNPLANEFMKKLNQATTDISKELIGENFNRFEEDMQEDTERLVDAIVKKGVVLEKEINLIMTRINQKKVSDKVVQKIWDEPPTLDKAQFTKGLMWLMNLWKTPTGKEKNSNPFGAREQETLETAKRMDWIGIHSERGNYYVPLYALYSSDGDYFQYYNSNGKVVLVG